MAPPSLQLKTSSGFPAKGAIAQRKTQTNPTNQKGENEKNTNSTAGQDSLLHSIYKDAANSMPQDGTLYVNPSDHIDFSKETLDSSPENDKKNGSENFFPVQDSIPTQKINPSPKDNTDTGDKSKKW